MNLSEAFVILRKHNFIVEATSQQYCMNCGAKVDPHDNYCGTCGAELDEDDDVQNVYTNMKPVEEAE